MIQRKQLHIMQAHRYLSARRSHQLMHRAVHCPLFIQKKVSLKKYLFLPANPNLVLMDTDIITKSPVRLTVAGMGDALATYFEARACKRSGATSCAGGKTTEAAMALAKLCFDTLMEEA